MKKNLFITIPAIVLLSGCNALMSDTAQKTVYVRVVNSGTVAVNAYILNEPTRHRPLQHFFPGLQPGDSTGYRRFSKISAGEDVTAVLDSSAVTRKGGHCKNCGIATDGKVTVYIMVIPAADTAARHIPRIEVRYAY